MRRLASITLLGSLALLTSNAQAQMRAGGSGGGMRSGGNSGGARMSSPAPRISSGRSMSPSPAFRGSPAARPSFAHGPAFSPSGTPVNSFNGRFTANSRVFFSGRDRRFHNGFFRNRFAFSNGFFGANCFGTFAFGNPFCGGFVGSAFLFGDPYFSLGYGYPYGGYGYYPGYTSPAPDYYPQQTSTSDTNNEVALTAEIQRLSDEIDDLRDNRRSTRDQQTQDRPAPSDGSTLTAVPPTAFAVFVLRDGRRFTAQNYAISGQTLWILNEHSARKTPLADIDRQATEKANAANGVEIRLPEPN
jgi:hypothetical protein